MDVKNEIRRAAQLQKQGQTAQSLPRFRAIARQYPEQIVPWLAIATLSRDQAERQKALALALRLQPQNEIALRLRRKLGPGQETAVPTPPFPPPKPTPPAAESIVEQIGRAAVLRRQGQDNAARAIFRAVTKQSPDNITAWWGLLTTSQSIAQKQEAVSHILRLDPGNERAQGLRRSFMAQTQARLPSTKTTPAAAGAPGRPARPRPTKLIIFTWFLTITGILPAAGLGTAGLIVGVVVGLATPVCAIILIRHGNRAAKTNGWIIMVIWLLFFGVGFCVGFAGVL